MLKKFLVIGNPIDHSLSPFMHNWVFKKLKIDAKYQKLKISDSELPNIIKKINNENIDGINVTIPYKNRIIKYLDIINPRAKSINAVNIVYKSNNKIIGNNTDWYGFTMALKKNNISVIDKEIIILGSGGSAKSIVFSLINLGVKKINIISQNNKNHLFKNKFVNIYNYNQLSRLINANSIIINTTPIGMINNNLPIDSMLLSKEQTIIDIIYTPLETNLIKHAKELGAVNLNGLDMFIYQGLATIDIWFGSPLSKQVNLVQLKEYLGSHLC